jgi:hypothetical protein
MSLASFVTTLSITLACTSGADGFFVSISDKAYPFINDVSSGLTLAWSYGSYAQLTRSSIALRVNERGVNFIHTGSVRDLAGSSDWTSHDCYDSTTSLCVLKDGSRVFPFDRVSIAANRSRVSPEIAEVALEGCRSTRESRRRISDLIYTYDISLCDVVDSRLDVLYLSLENRVLLRRNATPLWVYVLVSLVSVYLVSSIAQNVSALLSTEKTEENTDHGVMHGFMHHFTWTALLELGGIGTALLAILIPCFSEMVLVTHQELAYCVFAVVYVGLHSLYFLYRATRATHATYGATSGASTMLSFNLITGTLLLLTQGVYHTIANPYSGILLLMLSLRCFYKLLEDVDHQTRTFRALHTLYLVLDACLLVLSHYLGLRPTFLFRFSADVSFVIMLLFSWVVCGFIVK